jgi:hypothetical protein
LTLGFLGMLVFICVGAAFVLRQAVLEERAEADRQAQLAERQEREVSEVVWWVWEPPWEL